MAAAGKSTNFLCTSLMSVVSAATVASAATSMAATETSSQPILMQTTAEVTKAQIKGETLTLAELQSLTVAEIETDSNIAVTRTLNGVAAAVNQPTTFASEGDSRLPEPLNSSKLDSAVSDRFTSVSDLSDLQLKDSLFQTETQELRVAEMDTSLDGTIAPSENTPAASSSQTNDSPGEAESNPLAGVTSVSQLSDVQPTDWAFQALQSLVERYGCIEGYPDSTFRGNRAMTRYEFAAGLNACLERIEELIGSVKPALSEADLATVQRLGQEFATELAQLRGRVDSLEARTARLEATQFTTTTKLVGNIRFHTNTYFSGEGDTETNIQYNAFLGLLTSFTGRDLLIAAMGVTNTAFPELATSNAGRFVGSTREGLSDTAGAGNGFNRVRLISATYRFPIGDKLTVNLIAAERNRFNPILLRQFLPYYTIGSGPPSTFLEAPPIYLLGAGAGLALNYEISKGTVLSLTYLGTFANQAGSGSGLFNGDYIAVAQLNYNPSPKFFLQALYHHGYFGTRTLPDGSRVGNFAFNNGQFFRGNGFVGSALANRFDDEDVFFEEASAVSSNAYQLGGYYAFTPKFILGGWVNYINARLLGKGDADIWTYSVQAAFPDLFKQGNVGGLAVGMEPTLTGLRKDGHFVGGFENDTSLHIEAYYKYQVTNNISVTPSVIWITAPNQDADNEDIVIGGIRTTFTF